GEGVSVTCFRRGGEAREKLSELFRLHDDPFRHVSSGNHLCETLCDDLFRIAHDTVDQLLAGRDVVDQARDHAAAPGPGFNVALLHDARVNAADEIDDILNPGVGALFALDLDHF